MDPTGWSAKDIAEAAVILGSSKVATAVLVIVALFIVGRYWMQPYFASRKKGGTE